MPSFSKTTIPRWGLLALTPLWLAACAGLTPADPGHDAPPTQALSSADSSRAAAAAAGSAWWSAFGDPLLPQWIADALAANPDLATARASLAQARAQADVQQAGLGPRLGASASAQRSQSGGNDAGNRFQAGFDASWEPDAFGGKRSALDASEADADASAASLANLQVSLAAEVAVNYIQLRGLQARLAIARSNLATQDETLQLTRWRAQAGLVSSLDVEQAVSAAEQTRAQIPALQTSLDQSANALAVLTGRNPRALDALRDSAAPIPAAPPDLAASFPADTLRQRPDVRAAELRASAALARVGVAEAALYPSFQLSGSLGLSALSLGSLTSGASLLKSLLLGVSAPLFDGGAGKAQVRVQQAAWQQASGAYRAAVLAALQEVEDALAALRGDRERLARLQASSVAAAHAELLARQRYRSGLIDFNTVLNTQRSLLAAQDSEASAQASLTTNHVRLYKALGGGWQAGAAAGPRPAARELP